jgi:hypothetical protein
MKLEPDMLDKNSTIAIDFDDIYGKQPLSQMRNQNS